MEKEKILRKNGSVQKGGPFIGHDVRKTAELN
jgi:hypothetical protein